MPEKKIPPEIAAQLIEFYRSIPLNQRPFLREIAAGLPGDVSAMAVQRCFKRAGVERPLASRRLGKEYAAPGRGRKIAACSGTVRICAEIHGVSPTTAWRRRRWYRNGQRDR